LLGDFFSEEKLVKLAPDENLFVLSEDNDHNENSANHDEHENEEF